MITEAELAAFHATVARLRALPADDPVRLNAERVAESFAREGRQRRKKVRTAERAEADAAVDAATVLGALDRLTVLGVDLRDPRQVLGLAESLRADGRPLDILVNNAAQTVRRPPESYAALIGGETGVLPPNAVLAPGFSPMLVLGQSPGALALAGVDEAGLLPDTAPVNSWSVRVGELDAAEVLETQLVNALAPTLLCDRLLPLLLASPHPRRYIVNVTAVEGRFAVRNKTSGHPHTNMAKAALNMLTRTSGPELAEQGVYMCSVDTGWITDENPMPKKTRIAGNGFRTPLDIVDGAARVYDPIVRGERGSPSAGVFLKDYREAAW